MANKEYRIIDGNQGTLIGTTDKLNEALRIRYEFEMQCGTNEAIIRDENGIEIDPEYEMEYVPEEAMTITVKTKTNGYKAETLQAMIAQFNKAAAKLFPECTVRHFYYGDRLDMVDIVLGEGNYAHFNITANRVSLSGYETTNEDLRKFETMTYKDELYHGKLMEY